VCGNCGAENVLPYGIEMKKTIQPNQFWIVKFEARKTVIEISPDPKYFFVLGTDVLHPVEQAEFIQQISV